MWIEISWPKGKEPEGIVSEEEREKYVVVRTTIDKIKDYPLRNAHIWICGQGKYNDKKSTIICGLDGEPLVPIKFDKRSPIFVSNYLAQVDIVKKKKCFEVQIRALSRRGSKITETMNETLKIKDKKVENTPFNMAIETGVEQIRGETSVHYYLERFISNLNRKSHS